MHGAAGENQRVAAAKAQGLPGCSGGCWSSSQGKGLVAPRLSHPVSPSCAHSHRVWESEVNFLKPLSPSR